MGHGFLDALEPVGLDLVLVRLLEDAAKKAEQVDVACACEQSTVQEILVARPNMLNASLDQP
jgi:hypothetical protein